MTEHEPLREALLEIELLRRREAARARVSNAILAALEAMTTTSGASEGIVALLESIRYALNCGLVALFDAEDDDLVMRFPEDHLQCGKPWSAQGLRDKPRRIVNFQGTEGLWDNVPSELAGWQSLLSVPISDGRQKMVVVAFSEEKDAFTKRDADLLKRLTTVAAQAIVQRALEQRSSFL